MRDISHNRHNRLILLFLFNFITFLGSPLFFELNESTKYSTRDLAGSGYHVSIRTAHISDATLPGNGSDVLVPIGITKNRDHF